MSQEHWDAEQEARLDAAREEIRTLQGKLSAETARANAAEERANSLSETRQLVAGIAKDSTITYLGEQVATLEKTVVRLETICDPAGDQRALVAQTENAKALAVMVKELEAQVATLEDFKSRDGTLIDCLKTDLDALRAQLAAAPDLGAIEMEADNWAAMSKRVGNPNTRATLAECSRDLRAAIATVRASQPAPVVQGDLSALIRFCTDACGDTYTEGTRSLKGVGAAFARDVARQLRALTLIRASQPKAVDLGPIQEKFVAWSARVIDAKIKPKRGDDPTFEDCMRALGLERETPDTPWVRVDLARKGGGSTPERST